jgi:signal transduction histidine kinase
MDFKALLQPDGRPFRIVPYVMAYGLVGTSGPLVVALKYQDYMWMAALVATACVSALAILAAAHAIDGIFGKRLTAAAAIALAVIVGCFACELLSMYIHEVVLGMEPNPHKPFLYRLSGVRGPLLWWGLGAAAWYYLKRSELHAAEVARASLDAEQLRASMAEARLQALQAQVEPHFLFNTLAHVKWLYRRDPESGRRMLDRLVDYLHAALPQVRQSTTTLEQELQLAQAYLDIQQLRIGGRLAFHIDVPDEIAQLRFPPLMLLTLVENSIKHGIAPQTGGGVIDIHAEADDRKLRIEVRDTGAGLREAKGTGLGLANVRARLAALFGAGARLIIEPNLPHGVVAAIEIPR